MEAYSQTLSKFEGIERSRDKIKLDLLVYEADDVVIDGDVGVSTEEM